MQITDLSTSKQKALAKDIKSFIEPDKARTPALLKETDLRQFLVKKGITASLKDVIQLLESFYAEITVRRLMSKIQQSVVWDTSLVGLTIQKLGELLYRNPRTNIFITSVLDELKKKMNEPDINNSNKFKYLYYSIISDTNSEFSTIVDYKSDEDYTDNQILQFALENQYKIYTYDYTMGLRAKSRQIPVSIFNRITEVAVAKYTPVPNGKNIILTPGLIKSLTVEEVIKTAHILHGAKFVLTYDFIEELEKLKQNTSTREYINFFVYDEHENYTIYALHEENSNYELLCKKYNAIVLTDSDSCAIFLKLNQIPYHLILDPGAITFLEKMNTQITLSQKIIHDDTEGAKELVSAAEHETAPALIPSVTTSKIPYYNPWHDVVRFKASAPVGEKIWVLNKSYEEIKPKNEKYRTKCYKALPGYFVIHGVNHLDGTYSLTVYKIIVKGTFKTGQIMQTFSLTKESDIPKEYRHFASVLILST